MRNDNKNTETTPVQEIKDGRVQDDGALSRWSRRKQQALIELETDSLPVADTTDVEPELPVLTDAEMPPVESLSEDSDYSGFLSPGVSEELRAIALRKLFRGAKFNIRDGLDDYDDDFRAVTLLKDVLIADATDKINEASKQDSEDEKEEPDQVAQESASISNEPDIAEDLTARKELAGTQGDEHENRLDDENSDEAKNNGEGGAV